MAESLFVRSSCGHSAQITLGVRSYFPLPKTCNVYCDGPCNGVKSNGKCNEQCNVSIFLNTVTFSIVRYCTVRYGHADGINTVEILYKKMS